MASSTLDRTGEQAPVVTKGHGTDALGPSDTSDSGSDVVGGPGLARDMDVLPRTGSTSDPIPAGSARTAGPDVGDANLDSDSDAGGTGERAAAGRDSPFVPSRDIAPDRVVGDETLDDEELDEDGIPPADQVEGPDAGESDESDER
jgi:hypothetical protein